jgi:sulfite exporter TauE/SafE/copper chaperone CopZ
VNLTAVLLTGLLAGGVTCAAVQGGLLAGLITRQRAVAVGASGATTSSRAMPPRATGSRGARLVDDLLPVGAFLTGKLSSHTVLGALLGALGGIAQLSPRVSAAVQMIAGAVILIFGLAQLGVPGLRRITIEPPRLFSRLVLRSTRSRAAFAPGLLGLASILIPCGVTLSVEALALASGSALAGAATMAWAPCNREPSPTPAAWACTPAPSPPTETAELKGPELPPETSATLELTVHGMHCGSCALLIDDALADLPGIISSHTSSKNGRSAITHDHRTNQAQIVATIQDLGYRAEPTS